MLRIQFRIRPCTCFGPLTDPSNSNKPFSISSNPSHSTSPSPSCFKLTIKINNSNAHKSSLLSCKSSHSNSSGLSWSRDDDDEEFLEAFVLASETVEHYQLCRQGFVDGTKWRSSGQFLPFPLQAKEPKSSINSIGHGFLRRFRSPTIFLKIACDGDVLLPIIVGEFAIEMLIDAFRGNGNGESPDQFEFVRNLVGTLGYENAIGFELVARKAELQVINLTTILVCNCTPMSELPPALPIQMTSYILTTSSHFSVLRPRLSVFPSALMKCL